MPEQNDNRPPLPDLGLVFVQDGSFQMGNDDADAYGDEKIIHPVKLSAFYIGKYPVTQRLWKAVMDAEAFPSYFQGDLRPKENVSWDDAKEFIEKLNSDEGVQRYVNSLDPPGAKYRLPTEAEWEYAARGGNAFPETGSVTSEGFKYSGSNKLKEVGWYGDNSHDETKPVGLKFPNELGIFDMSGNVWEWCEDDWHSDYKGAPDNGSAWVDSPERGAYRVYRGGSCFNGPLGCRPARRDDHTAGGRDLYLGFRLALPFQ